MSLHLKNMSALLPASRHPWRLSRATVTVVATVWIALLIPALGVLIGQRVFNEPSAAPLPYRIDINHASEAELALLPGVGPALAARVVNDRVVHGPFRDADDLRRVKGIGPATAAGVAPCVRVELSTR